MLKVSELHKKAGDRLQNTENPKRLALIHTAIALGASFLLLVLSMLSERMIADTGGLRGMGTRATLSTVENMLNLIITIALPFWQMGIFYAALGWIKAESAGFSHLLQGFRRWSSVLGSLLLQALLYIILGFAVAYMSSAVFVMTPLATPFINIMAPMMDPTLTPEKMSELLTPELMESATQAAIPLFIIFGALFVLAAIPVFYRIRFASLAVMDGQTAGKSLIKSFLITRKSFWRLVKLDLSFWWFYLLQILSVVICNADLLLPSLRVTLPVSGTAATVLFYALGSIGQLLLLWQFEAKRVTVYALAYRTLDTASNPESAPEEA